MYHKTGMRIPDNSTYLILIVFKEAGPQVTYLTPTVGGCSLRSHSR